MGDSPRRSSETAVIVRVRRHVGPFPAGNLSLAGPGLLYVTYFVLQSGVHTARYHEQRLHH